MTEEEKRLQDASWRKWGPYLSERQWGTVREDYSASGDAWRSVSHEEARSHIYRWGEEGIAGISDEKMRLCFAPAFWNGQDAILKERLFGLDGFEGNHGEDVKEVYFYLDNLPTHAYMKYLYKYPQQAFPYEALKKENAKRTRKEREYELLDTGIFDEDRYFDIFIEYAKAAPNDLLIEITVWNRGPEKAPLHLLPTLWFRNSWSWEAVAKPQLFLEGAAIHAEDYFLYFEGEAEPLFTENERGRKEALHRFVIQGERQALNANGSGTKAAFHKIAEIAAGESQTYRLRLVEGSIEEPFSPLFEQIFAQRREEADAFYERITPSPLPEDMRKIQRQAFAGLLWNKQCYHFNVRKWLDGDPLQPPPPEERKEARNSSWRHFDAFEIFSMPDKWEYPWFASWDLAFHTVVLAMIDPAFAKEQLLILTREWYMHSNGQLPAYEWEFGNVNPPVHAWAALRIYQIEKRIYGREDRNFLKRIFHKLLLNFTWWVNRKDHEGRNIFEGGFLGLDNIGVFDRSEGIPLGGRLEQPDGTGWMGMYSLNLWEIALELATQDPVYEDMATKFFEHFVGIAAAINCASGQKKGLWAEDMGQYCGRLLLPDGRKFTIKLGTFVGFIPLFAVAVGHTQKGSYPEYQQRFHWYVEHRPDRLEGIGDFSKLANDGNLLLSLVDPEKLKVMLQRLLNEEEFLSAFGLRSNSKIHEKEPSIVQIDEQTFTLDYEPAESTVSLFGGNSNWRGPVWFPLNYLLIEALQKYHFFLGDSFQVEYPIGSGKRATLWEVASDLSHRLIKIFLRDEEGRRPLYGERKKFQEDPHWRDYIHFHEYFHGDNGAGLGASNQTGWTALVAKLIEQYGVYAIGKKAPFLAEKNN